MLADKIVRIAPLCVMIYARSACGWSVNGVPCMAVDEGRARHSGR